MCIMCFLKEKFQYSLRKNAQLRSDRFEHTLAKYKDFFIDEFIYNKDLLCDNHNNLENKIIINCLTNIEIQSIEQFFDSLIKIYVLWIDGQLSESIKIFKELLINNKLLDFYSYIDDTILYRGRISTSFISHWDMFHIPFNKRFCIGNQRYSLGGQPLLYLASSPYCVFRELQSYNNLKISSFRSKKNTNKKIFNNSNIFYKYIMNNDDKTTLTTTKKIIKDNININEDNKFEKMLFLAILASCCSFERRNELRNSTFCEEYILPQILSQIIKSYGFKGIMYTSTKAYYDNNVKDDEEFINLIYKNICIFTTYNIEKAKVVTYVYDKDLYEEFILSAPLNFEIDTQMNEYDIGVSLKLINELTSQNKKMKELNENVIFGINNTLVAYNDKNINIFRNLEQKLTCDKSEEKINFEKAIYIHCVLLKNIILNIREEFREDYRDGEKNKIN